MRSNTRNYILTAAGTLAILAFCPELQAIQTITLTNTPYTYEGQSVGPYTASITPTPGAGLLVFCLDGNKTYSSTTGTLYSFADSSFQNLSGQSTLDQHEEEAAFLASYSLTLDPNHNKISTDEGPIQLAIWSIMGTLPSSVTVSSTVNSAAYAFVLQAQNLVTTQPNLFLPTSTFMSTVSVWMPTNYPTVSNQRFITVGALPPQILNATPEPGTMVFLGTGVLLLALSRVRRRRC